MRGNKIEKNLDGYILIKIIITHFYDVLFLIIISHPLTLSTKLRYNTTPKIQFLRRAVQSFQILKLSNINPFHFQLNLFI